MAPHAALVIPDILDEIFRHLSPCPELYLPDDDLGEFSFPIREWHSDPRDLRPEVCKAHRLALACAARTCKAFRDPASRVLWEVLDGLGPILSVSRSTETQTCGGSQVNTLDWFRFEYISKRIRALSCRAVGDDLDVFSRLCSHYGRNRPILPNLRALLVPSKLVDEEAGSRRLLDAVRGLCASSALVFLSLKTLTIAKKHDIVLLDVLAECCPGLLHFQIPDLVHLHRECSRALERFTSLRTARFRCINETMLHILWSLPELRTLRGDFFRCNLPVATAVGNNNTRNAFPALQKLHTSDNIPSNDVEFSGTVLPLISSTSLTVLDLTVSLRSPSKIPEYFDEICSSAAIAPLRQLHLRIYVTSRPQCAMGMGIFARDTVTHRIPFADILPHLARLPALTDISISTESRILSNDSPSVLVALLDVCDEDLAAVAAAWPDLARLSIAYSDWAGRCRGPCMPSLGAVVALAGRCRKLERVDVEFADVDADELVRLEARASTSTSTSLGTCCTPAPGESGSGSESSQSLREVQTALRQIATVSGLRPQPPSQHRTGNIYLKYEHHERLSVAEPLRLAAALRKLFPNLRSGLEESHVVAGGMEEGLRRGDNDMVIDPETDAMRLLKALDELDLDAEL